MTNDTQTGLTRKSPKALYVIALLCIILGVFITPEQLIALGPMRLSLTSEIESVREIAYLEVLLARIFLCGTGLLLTILGFTWQRLINSSLIQSINAHVPMGMARHNTASRLFNKSLFITMGCVVMGILYIVLGARLFTSTQLSMIHGEDGVMEYMSAFFFLCCAALSAILAFKSAGQYARVAVYGIFAFVFFVMVGEEISWGQRIFNLEPTGIFESVNVQGEINLHNSFGYFADHLFIAAILMYGFLLPLLVHFNLFARKLFDFVGIPIASLGLAIGFLIASMFQRWIVFEFIAQPPGFRIDELRELLSAIALTLLMYESWQLLQGGGKISRQPQRETIHRLSTEKSF